MRFHGTMVSHPRRRRRRVSQLTTEQLQKSPRRGPIYLSLTLRRHASEGPARPHHQARPKRACFVTKHMKANHSSWRPCVVAIYMTPLSVVVSLKTIWREPVEEQGLRAEVRRPDVTRHGFWEIREDDGNNEGYATGRTSRVSSWGVLNQKIPDYELLVTDF
jgi:hypothetical protein